MSETVRKTSAIGELAGVTVDEQQKDRESVVKRASAYDIRRASDSRASSPAATKTSGDDATQDTETTMNFYVSQQAELKASKN